MFSLRPVTLADRPAMLDICATVWDGNDYVPDIFEAWVADPQGCFAAIEVEGRMVGFSKLSRLAAGEHWLEGIRVHGDFRGRGLASVLHDHLVATWLALPEGGTLRLVTESPAILHACERTGFRLALSFVSVEAPAQSTPHGFERVAVDEHERAWEHIQRSAWLTETRGLCDVGWKRRAFTRTYLAEQMAAGHVWRWRDWEGVLLASAVNRENQPTERLRIQFPAVTATRRAEFLAEARGLAHALGKTIVRWCPPPRAEVKDDFTRAGFVQPEEDLGYCLELAK
jgi:GNAT superfamily N-acetyltransferase